jgi:hypothetical protein
MWAVVWVQAVGYLTALLGVNFELSASINHKACDSNMYWLLFYYFLNNVKGFVFTNFRKV